ncbi:hypothetical protein GZA08_17800 [Pseudoroseicyclus sp. CLL3-39]|uniref:Uncharacterized protein n=1 Tax=Pseudoroseicyclus tamaricis TaxID=2705421 RepID=A0A6B2JMK3_9RHOB|nr:hypothetical protein [Pseudoroseicyclus tamaricis]
MTFGLRRLVKTAAVMATGLSLSVGSAAYAHHSFAMFDNTQVRVFTGVVTRINPDANHLQIFFAPLNDEHTTVVRDEAGDPIIWAVEMAGSAQAAAEGITVNNFAPGTIFSVGLYPLRNGQPGGDRGNMGLWKCPANTPPAPGQMCDSVDGATQHGEGEIPVNDLELDQPFVPGQDYTEDAEEGGEADG